MSEAVDNNLLKIAKVLKSNGTDGEIIIGFREFAPEDINQKEPVFIYYDGLPVPFFIKSFKLKGTSRALVRLNDILSYKDAEEIVGRDIFAERNTLEYDENNFSAIIGWIIKDENGTTIGTIANLEEIPGNLCINVETKEGQIMLPLHEDLILSLDESRQEIIMTIPAGLL